MGLPPDIPEVYLPASAPPADRIYFPPTPYPRRQEPLLRYLVLFLLTMVTTTWAGQFHYANYLVGFSNQTPDLSAASLFSHGLWYSLSILGILGAHEFGHYYACRHYEVDASAPFFLPMPLPLTGTLGAFIRIRQPFPSKRALFDIGIAGPIAGFIVAIPVLMAGMYLSRVIEVPQDFQGAVIELGEPLLFKFAAWLTFGSIPEGSTVNMHPMAFAAWFGLLATALNLLPIGQLDGGHVSYAVLGRRSTWVTLAMIPCLVGLTFVATWWRVWLVLTVIMLVVFGPRHPRVYDEDVPLDRTRLWLALFAVLMFILCFSPAPIELLDLVRS